MFPPQLLSMPIKPRRPYTRSTQTAMTGELHLLSSWSQTVNASQDLPCGSLPSTSWDMCPPHACTDFSMPLCNHPQPWTAHQKNLSCPHLFLPSASLTHFFGHLLLFSELLRLCPGLGLTTGALVPFHLGSPAGHSKATQLDQEKRGTPHVIPCLGGLPSSRNATTLRWYSYPASLSLNIQCFLTFNHYFFFQYWALTPGFFVCSATKISQIEL